MKKLSLIQKSSVALFGAATLLLFSTSCGSSCCAESFSSDSSDEWYSVSNGNGKGKGKSKKELIKAGPFVNHNFNVSSDFTGVELSGWFDVVFVQSSNASDFQVKGYLPDNLIEHLDVHVKGGKLFIGLKPGNYSLQFKDIKQTPTIYVTNKALTSVRTTGSADFTIQGDLTVTGGDFTVRNTGSSDFNAGKIIANGGKATFSVSGSGNIDVSSIECSNLNVNISGSADVEFDYADVQNADLSVSGSGDIEISGVADRVRLSVSGSGDINARGLKAKSGEAYSSGSGDISCSVYQLRSHSTGSSEIHNH